MHSESVRIEQGQALVFILMELGMHGQTGTAFASSGRPLSSGSLVRW